MEKASQVGNVKLFFMRKWLGVVWAGSGTWEPCKKKKKLLGLRPRDSYTERKDGELGYFRVIKRVYL